MPIKKRPAPRPETADDGQVRGRFSRTRLWLVDMDDTIFNASAGMLEAIGIDPTKVCTYCWDGKE